MKEPLQELNGRSSTAAKGIYICTQSMEIIYGKGQYGE